MELSRDGISQLSLTAEEISVVQQAFQCASKTLDEITEPNLCEHLIDPNQDSYSCSGFHPLGGTLSSKYNKYREGFIFSNGEIFDLATGSDDDNFGATMRETASVLHSLATKALAEVESTLGLPSNYIRETYGKDASLTNTSQWHLKRYSADAGNADDDLALGVHTDPSILSVVVHDSPTLEPGGWGLQYSKKLDDPPIGGKEIAIEWKEPPYHGHGIATVMIGSAFARIMQVGENESKNEKVSQVRKMYPPCRHRVVMLKDTTEHVGRRRMALTYFLRPSPSSILTPLPIFLEHVCQPRKQVTFGLWYNKVSSNYNRSKAKTKQNSSNR